MFAVLSLNVTVVVGTGVGVGVGVGLGDGVGVGVGLGVGVGVNVGVGVGLDVGVGVGATKAVQSAGCDVTNGAKLTFELTESPDPGPAPDGPSADPHQTFVASSKGAFGSLNTLVN